MTATAKCPEFDTREELVKHWAEFVVVNDMETEELTKVEGVELADKEIMYIVRRHRNSAKFRTSKLMVHIGPESSGKWSATLWVGDDEYRAFDDTDVLICHHPSFQNVTDLAIMMEIW